MPQQDFFVAARPPDRVLVQPEAGEGMLARSGKFGWSGLGVDVTTEPIGERLPVVIRGPGAEVRRLCLRWDAAGVPSGARLLGDAWERG